MYNLQKREVLLEEVCQESPCDVELDVENRETQATIMRLINALDPKYRDVLVMRFYLDMKEKEIAEALEISVQNVKVRLHRGKNMVKKRLLEEKHYDGETV